MANAASLARLLRRASSRGRRRVTQLPCNTPSVLCGLSMNKPLSSMTTAANALHEFYLSFISAGFTEDQALKLTAELLKISRGSDDES